jgi:hypothetical protein
MCQVAIPIFSNLDPPTNLFLPVIKDGSYQGSSSLAILARSEVRNVWEEVMNWLLNMEALVILKPKVGWVDDTWNAMRAQLRAGLHHGPWTQTMEDGLFSWSDLMVEHPWSAFLENQFIKSLGPSLGVNQMWTKRNDHALKVNVLIFLTYTCP